MSEPTEVEKLRAALRVVADYLEALLDDGKFPPKGRSDDDKDAMVGWWEDRYGAVKRAHQLLAR